MDLRSLKKEIDALPNAKILCRTFQEQWLKPIRVESNHHLPFLQHLSPAAKKEANVKLKECASLLTAISYGATLQQKLRRYGSLAFDLKLNLLRHDQRKSKLIISNVIHDESLNIKSTIKEVQQFAEHVQELASRYQAVNSLLQQELSLEDSLVFFDSSHKKYLTQLQRLAREQKRLLREVGEQFIVLTKEKKW